jgi:hypothetical protein
MVLGDSLSGRCVVGLFTLGRVPGSVEIGWEASPAKSCRKEGSYHKYTHALAESQEKIPDS